MKKNIVIGEVQEEFKKKPIDPGGIIIPYSNSLLYKSLDPHCSNKDTSMVNILSGPEEPLDLSSYENDLKEEDPIDNILARLDLKETTNLHHNKVKSYVSSCTSKLKIIKLIDNNIKLYELISKDSESDLGYKIQLSSALSEKEAEDEWQRLQKKYSKYLKNVQPTIKKVNVTNDRIIYIVMAGNYSSISQAKLVCKKLISEKQSCTITE